MKKFSKIFCVLLSALFLVTALTACGGSERVGVTVKIVSISRAILESDVTVQGASPTADKAIIKACQDKNFAYTYENGMFDNFDGLASTQTDGWIFYVNSELMDVGAGSYALKEGDVVEFRYVNYDEVFAQNG